MKLWRLIVSHAACFVLGWMLIASLTWPNKVLREVSSPEGRVAYGPPSSLLSNCNGSVSDEVASSAQDVRYISCDVRSHAGRIKTIPAGAMRPCTLANMMKTEPPPYLPGYRNPCWLEDGGALRCLPRIIVAGLMKCGTSELFRNLDFHPHVLHGTDKEIHFWDSTVAKGGSLQTYAGSFTSATNTIGRKCSNHSGLLSHHMVAVDATPDTFYRFGAFQSHPDNQGRLEPRVLAPDVIGRLIPGAKIVLILRDPVTRLYSQFLFFHARLESSHVNPEDFHQEVVRGIAFYRQCFKQHPARACAYMNTRPKSRIDLHIGFYDIYMKDWLGAIPRQNIHVMRLEDYSVAKVEETRKLFRFLELDDPPPTVYEEIRNANVQNARRAHARDVGDMQLHTRQLLRSFYSEHNHNLAKLLEDDRWTWGY